MKELAKNLMSVICALGLLSGCQQSSNGPTRGPDPKVEGSSTGGGSFGDESSLTILGWASSDLANQISNSSPEIYSKLPKGWTQQRLAQVIHDVEPTKVDRESYSIPEVTRYGQRLMFNYGQRKDGTPFITATRLFVDAYSHYDVNTRPKQEFYYTIEEVKLKLIHEAAHLMGLGLSKESDMPEARTFAKSVLESLDSDNFECLPTTTPPRQIYTPLEVGWTESGNINEPKEAREAKFFRTKTRAYVFNRPSGRAAVPTNISIPCKGIGGPESFSNCPSQNDETASSGYITVFAPRSYDEKFDLTTIRKSIAQGIRDYGFKEGYFSWNLVDLRKAVLTEEGYRSNYKYSRENALNNTFSEYLDFFVTQSSPSKLELESYPPLQQENWAFYRSQGKSKIFITFTNGQISDAKLIVLKDYSRWLEDKEPNDYNVQVPLTCIRSYKPLKVVDKIPST
jgi:hypothetical protein